MTTSLFNKLLKIATAVSAFCVLALTNPVAASGPNLLVNGSFTHADETYQPSGWTVKRYSYLSSVYAWGVAEEVWLTSSASLGINNVLFGACDVDCPTSGYNTIGQQVNGLVPGHQYQFSYYATGYSLRDAASAGLFPIGNIVVSLGSQEAPPVVPPVMNWTPTSWGKQTYTFNYTSQSTSAWLTIKEFFSGLPVTCEPCYEYMYLANASLSDVTPVGPILKVQKALGTAGRINDADQFLVAIRNASTSAVLNSASTSGTGNTVTGGLASISGDTTTTYKVTEEMVAGSNSKLAQYDAALSCSNANSSGTQFPSGSIQVGQDFPLLKAGDDVTCTLTNTPKTPTLRLTKALGTGGRIDNADQFTVQILQRISTVKDGTTSGSGSTITDGSTGVVGLVSGSSYTLNEVMKAGSASKLTQYDGVVTCTNAWASSPTSVPSVPGTAFSPTYGDVLDCTITNTAKPVKLTLTQQIITPFPVNLMPPFTFNYSINNGWPLQPQPLTTTAFNVPVSTAQRNLAASNVNTTLSTSLPDARWTVSSFACTDTNAANTGNPTGNLVRVVATSVTVPAANVKPGSALKCTLTMGHKVP